MIVEIISYWDGGANLSSTRKVQDKKGAGQEL